MSYTNCFSSKGDKCLISAFIFGLEAFALNTTFNNAIECSRLSKLKL